MKSKSTSTTKREADGTKEVIESTHQQNGAPFLPESTSKELADAILAPAHIVELDDLTPVALMPAGWKAENLTGLLPARAPTFRSGSVSLDDQESLVAYVLRHRAESTVLYASRDEKTGGGLITAVLDDGEPTLPGRRVDRATLHLQPDPRFAAWLAIEGKAIPQKPFMAFIEDHDREFTTPSGAQMRTYVNQLEVKKLSHFRSVEKEDSAAADVSIIYETDTQQIGEAKFPQVFTLAVPLLRFTPPVTINGRIRFQVNDGAVVFCIRLEDIHTLFEAAWQGVLFTLRETLPGIPVLNGRP